MARQRPLVTSHSPGGMIVAGGCQTSAIGAECQGWHRVVVSHGDKLAPGGGIPQNHVASSGTGGHELAVGTERNRRDRRCVVAQGNQESARGNVPDTGVAQAMLGRGEAGSLEEAQAAARDKLLRGARSALIGEFYGSFFFWVNLVGVLTQMFLVSRIFKYLGVRVALFILPVIAFGGYSAIALIGGLAVLRVAKTAENSTDYSLQNTVKQALFLPTSREAKYKAKAAIDTFFVRFGDTASAGIVALGLHVVQIGAREFAWFNLGLVLVWILLNVTDQKMNVALAIASPEAPHQWCPDYLRLHRG